MARGHSFSVHPGWQILFADLNIESANVLRVAGLPRDLFARPRALLSTEEYFRLWTAVEAVSPDPALPLRIGAALSAEVFDPPIFAAFCSPNLNIALSRLATYKRLVCPMALDIDARKKATTVKVRWLDTSVRPPSALMGFEVVFFVQLARMATRTRLCPLEVVSPAPLEPADAYTEYFGVRARLGKQLKVSFSRDDAERPFLTANDAMWKTFEPELRKRLSELDQTASTSERVQAALLELLPSGSTSIEMVAQRLGTSSRTLQRRLRNEERSFQSVLNKTREDLARHYLRTTDMTGAEISFLLGFEDPNSFFRAFHHWTGETPEQARGALPTTG